MDRAEAVALVEHLREKGVEFRVEGGRLVYRAPKGLLNDGQKEYLRVKATTILATLLVPGEPAESPEPEPEAEEVAAELDAEALLAQIVAAEEEQARAEAEGLLLAAQRKGEAEARERPCTKILTSRAAVREPVLVARTEEVQYDQQLNGQSTLVRHAGHQSRAKP